MLSPRLIQAIKKHKCGLNDQTRINNSISVRRGPLNCQGRKRNAVSMAGVDAILSAPSASVAQYCTDMEFAGASAEVYTLGPRVLDRFLTFERFVCD